MKEEPIEFFIVDGDLPCLLSLSSSPGNNLGKLEYSESNGMWKQPDWPTRYLGLTQHEEAGVQCLLFMSFRQ